MYLWAPPVLKLETFGVQKISWWSDKPTLMTPFWETLEGKLAKIWSIRVEVLQVLELGIELVSLSRALYKTDDTFWHQQK